MRDTGFCKMAITKVPEFLHEIFFLIEKCICLNYTIAGLRYIITIKECGFKPLSSFFSFLLYDAVFSSFVELMMLTFHVTFIVTLKNVIKVTEVS